HLGHRAENTLARLTKPAICLCRTLETAANDRGTLGVLSDEPPALDRAKPASDQVRRYPTRG
ncbi:hypothetical protein, partial [Yoonia sp. R2-816]|uniref:hypothetical protein n=1 Tax=Yoonia sp. R2-816 TaxID=3342638 RepID=UPI0037265228